MKEAEGQLQGEESPTVGLASSVSDDGRMDCGLGVQRRSVQGRLDQRRGCLPGGECRRCRGVGACPLASRRREDGGSRAVHEEVTPPISALISGGRCIDTRFLW